MRYPNLRALIYVVGGLLPAMVLSGIVRGDEDQNRLFILAMSGWRVSPDSKHLLVPIWFDPVNPQAKEPVSDNDLPPSYRALILVDMGKGKNAFKIIPETVLHGGVHPDYLDDLIDWSSDSQYVVMPGQFANSDDASSSEKYLPVWYDLKQGKRVIASDVPVTRHCRLTMSPSGRYVVISTWSKDTEANEFLLWSPREQKVVELLNCLENERWDASDASIAWSNDEKRVYLAITTAIRSSKVKDLEMAVETWSLCECDIDSLPYTPQTARILFSDENRDVNPSPS